MRITMIIVMILCVGCAQQVMQPPPAQTPPQNSTVQQYNQHLQDLVELRERGKALESEANSSDDESVKNAFVVWKMEYTYALRDFSAFVSRNSPALASAGIEPGQDIREYDLT